MEAGIVGLPNGGKSTLFNALTSSQSAQSENYPFCTIEPNEGIVNVPDERLQRITKYITPQKVIPAALKLVDIAGFVNARQCDRLAGELTKLTAKRFRIELIDADPPRRDQSARGRPDQPGGAGHGGGVSKLVRLRQRRSLDPCQD